MVPLSSTLSFVIATQNATPRDSAPQCQTAGSPRLGNGRCRKLCSPYTQSGSSPEVFPKPVSVVTIVFLMYDRQYILTNLLHSRIE